MNEHNESVGDKGRQDMREGSVRCVPAQCGISPSALLFNCSLRGTPNFLGQAADVPAVMKAVENRRTKGMHAVTLC